MKACVLGQNGSLLCQPRSHPRKRKMALKLGSLSEFSEGMIYEGGQGIGKSQATIQNL